MRIKNWLLKGVIRVLICIGWFGRWEIQRFDRDGNLIERTGLKPNLITDAGLNMFRNLLSGAITDGEIKYTGLGSNSTAPSNANTTLGTEQYRKQVTSQSNGGTAGVLTTTTYIPPDEANTFKCEEIGWFAGATATATANTGILVARVLYSRQKTSLESWSIVRVDTIGRA